MQKIFSRPEIILLSCLNCIYIYMYMYLYVEG